MTRRWQDTMARIDRARATIATARAADLGAGQSCPTCGAPIELADPGPPTPDTCPDCGAPQSATRAPDLGAAKGTDDDIDF